MTPEQLLLDETREWVHRAQEDLRAVDLLNELPAEALFHCQQAAEKFMKAYLTFHQVPFRKTHELEEVGTACANVDPGLGSALDPSYVLSLYAWKFRYPGAQYEPHAKDVELARALAQSVRDEILRRLPSEAATSSPQ